MRDLPEAERKLDLETEARSIDGSAFGQAGGERARARQVQGTDRSRRPR